MLSNTFLKSLIKGFVFGALILCLVLLVMPNQSSLSKVYESYDFDFIIPLPWFSQIDEINAMDYVDNTTPYYLLNEYVGTDVNSVQSSVYMITSTEAISFTPFVCNDSYSYLSENAIIIDSKLSNILHVSVGDSVNLCIGDKKKEYRICGITAENPFSINPSCLIVIGDSDILLLKSAIPQLRYAGAFVKATDLSRAEQYFNYEYRPYGKIGEPSWYDSYDEYLYMKQSIEKQAVAMEIVNVHSLKVTENTNNTRMQDALKTSFIVSLVVSVLLTIGLWQLDYYVFIREYRNIIRNGVSLKKIEFSNLLGMICMLVTEILFIMFRHQVLSIMDIVLYVALLSASVVLNAIIFKRRMEREALIIKKKEEKEKNQKSENSRVSNSKDCKTTEEDINSENSRAKK